MWAFGALATDTVLASKISAVTKHTSLLSCGIYFGIYLPKYVSFKNLSKWDIFILWIFLSSNKLIRLQIFPIFQIFCSDKTLLFSLVVLASLSELCAPPHSIVRLSISQTLALLIGILVSFVNNFWLNIDL